MVNLECAIVMRVGYPIVKCGPNLSCDPILVDSIKEAGFNVLTLANNHFRDYGGDAVVNSLNIISTKGLDHVGAGKNLTEASRPLVKEIKGYRIAIINCCESEFSIATDLDPGCNPLDPVDVSYAIKKARSAADFVLLVVHSGVEFCQLPSPRMKHLFHFFIDQGADAIINHHQHCYSGYEVYNGKTIVYGLGNFCFDWEGKRKSSWNEGYIAKLFIKDDFSQQLAIFPYIQCDDTPGVHAMDEDSKQLFQSRLRYLNETIADDNCLIKEFTRWIDANERNTRMAISPYSGRIARALCSRGLIPAFLSKRRLVLLYNHIVCDSHRERLLRFIKKRI